MARDLRAPRHAARDRRPAARRDAAHHGRARDAQRIAAIGLIPYQSPSVEGIKAYIKAETEKWGTLVRQLGLQGSQ